MPRFHKQLIIAIIFFGLVGLTAFGIWQLTKPAPSCFDGLQNQGEEGIDCGGPCQPCEILTLQPLQILWTEAIPVQDNFYDALAQIKNPNQNYGSGQISYTFNFYDIEHHLIIQESGQTYILPSQTKYILVRKINSPVQIERVDLTINQEIQWKKLKDYQPPQFTIRQKEYRLLTGDEPGFSQASGIVVNKTNFDFDKVEVDVLLFDSRQRLIGLNSSQIRTLLAGQERHFVVTWFEPLPAEVASVEIEVETNLFDSANYMIRHGMPEKFQEY